VRNSPHSPKIKLFVAILTRPEVVHSETAGILAEVFGSLDYSGPRRLFDCTDYYEQEMGPGLLRSIISFTGPHYADILPEAKRACIEIERGCAIDNGSGELKRVVNLDIGYLDHHKVVLASAKGAGHKIYLADGIYADLSLRYSRRGFEPLPWSFPDLADGRYNDDFREIRRIFMGRA
jgi:hypothetical protein